MTKVNYNIPPVPKLRYEEAENGEWQVKEDVLLDKSAYSSCRDYPGRLVDPDVQVQRFPYPDLVGIQSGLYFHVLRLQSRIQHKYCNYSNNI